MYCQSQWDARYKICSLKVSCSIHYKPILCVLWPCAAHSVFFTLPPIITSKSGRPLFPNCFICLSEFWSAYLVCVRILFWFNGMAAVYLFYCGHSLTKEYTLFIDIYRSEIKPSAVTKLQCRDLLPFECTCSGWWHATGSL